MGEVSDQRADNQLKRVHVPAFDGLRGTVFTVMFVHLEAFFPIFADRRRTTFLLIDHTWFTLNLFFCLSGFLITWLLANEMEETGGLDLLNFYKRRTVRLAPAYLTAILATVVTALCFGFTAKAIFREVPLFLTYTYNIFRSFSPGTAPILGLFLTPVWSLCVEEQFYFGWSMALKRLKLRNALPTVICALIGLRIYRCALLFWMRGHGYSSDQIYNHFYFGTDTRIDAVLIGCAAALALQKRRYYDLAKKYLSSRPMPYLLPIAVTLIIFLTAPFGITSPAYQTYGAEISLALMAAWFVSILFQPTSLISRVLACRSLVFIGRISYGLYVFHFIVIPIVLHALGGFTHHLSLYRNLAGWLIVTAASMLFATVHYNLIERPLLKKFRSAPPLPARRETPNQVRPIPQKKPFLKPQIENVLS